ncbi:hypothetical protein AC579_6765 [Pseudocercospora musae]|uniref:Uncharacterized protein n=1 Tax=Pseudocercospora musae TaxID=113226 RepID=A0A139HF81_9PEZI|nr:hypothetical protein AC579_6765 [Pseudocercospora musae]KXT01100.1 hypothetical protein AC579_6765 [Pseudocercospora musae]KXT01101.1 hypothetical protein AC579_6765 [Pseudocercospora musae]
MPRDGAWLITITALPSPLKITSTLHTSILLQPQVCSGRVLHAAASSDPSSFCVPKAMSLKWRRRHRGRTGGDLRFTTPAQMHFWQGSCVLPEKSAHIL